MTGPLRGLCSKATGPVLAELSAVLEDEAGGTVHFESAGGVAVARRVRAGEQADVLVLADGVMRDLEAEGLLVPGSLRPLFRSEVVLGVPDHGPARAPDTVEELVVLLRGAGSIGYSTGPSGAALLAWLEASSLTAELGPRLVQAPPGVPVARLVAAGRADIGIQQRSELSGVPGVRVLGPLPGAAAATSTFTGAVLATSRRPVDAGRTLRALGASDLADRVRRRGMELLPAR